MEKISLTLSIECLKFSDSPVEKNIYILTCHLKSFEPKYHNAGYYVSVVLFQTVEFSRYTNRIYAMCIVRYYVIITFFIMFV